MSLRIKDRKQNGIIVIEIGGRLVGDYCHDLRRHINSLLTEMPSSEQPPKLILDLRQLLMADAAGLAVLVSAYTSTQERGGKLVLCDLGRGLQNMIASARLTRIFPIYESVDEAMESF